jgi:ribosome biogenesis GTPase
MAESERATVIAVHGKLLSAHVDGETVVVSARRQLRWLGGSDDVRRLVVGDRVHLVGAGDDRVVEAVEPRRTRLLRRSPKTGRAQILVANVDQALVVMATIKPEPKRGLLDRFLVACAHAGIEPTIVFNKVDHGLGLATDWIDLYRTLGYRVLTVSARTGRGLGAVKRSVRDRVTVFCGPSGAGKSSLLNAIDRRFRLKVGGLSEATGKGRHTTSQAELLPLNDGGFVVDTPGLKEFGLWGLAPADVAATFPELEAHARRCRFPNCTHLHEPDCAVQHAVATGDIDHERYRIYATLVAEQQATTAPGAPDSC